MVLKIQISFQTYPTYSTQNEIKYNKFTLTFFLKIIKKTVKINL